MNDFLNNTKPGNAKASSLLRASVSSMNIVQLNLGGDNEFNKRYDSFRVASNFFIRLRKEGVDIEDNENNYNRSLGLSNTD